MIDKFCEYLTNKIRKKMPDVDDERAEVIKYGLQILIGEVPKIFAMIAIAWVLGCLKYTLLCFLLLLPYRMYSGGFHLKTHIGCIIGTSALYIGNAFVSQFIHIELKYKIILCILLWIFAIAMIYKYAPADTEAVPIVSKRERKKRRNISYIIVTVMLICVCVIKFEHVSNMLLIGTLLQTLTITRLAYKLTNNRFGYEEYLKQKNAVIN